MTQAVLMVSVLLMAHVLGGCDSKPTAGAPPPPPVTVARPLEKTITEWDEYTGRFTAVETVEVRARVSGFIDSIHFKEGQVVKQGDLLFVIDPRPYTFAVEQAKADVERAKAKLADSLAGRATRNPACAQPGRDRARIRYQAIDRTRRGGPGCFAGGRLEAGTAQSRMDPGARTHRRAHFRQAR